MKHKHYDCIVAWAEGKQIQLKWIGSNKWEDVNHPNWNIEYEYRIKPTTIKFRNYLYYGLCGKCSIGICRSTDMRPADMSIVFIKWIGDWQEVEVDS